MWNPGHLRTAKCPFVKSRLFTCPVANGRDPGGGDKRLCPQKVSRPSAQQRCLCVEPGRLRRNVQLVMNRLKVVKEDTVRGEIET